MLKAFIYELFLAMEKILDVDYDLPQDPYSMSSSTLWRLFYFVTIASCDLISKDPFALGIHKHRTQRPIEMSWSQPSVQVKPFGWEFDASDASKPSVSFETSNIFLGWLRAGMCTLLHFFQACLLHLWLLHRFIAAVQADVSWRLDVIFYSSGKGVWNTTKGDGRFICAWQGNRRERRSAVPCS